MVPTKETGIGNPETAMGLVNALFHEAGLAEQFFRGLCALRCNEGSKCRTVFLFEWLSFPLRPQFSHRHNSHRHQL